eukprot:SAG31_NODE_279_length_18600_cov_21.254527_4_plen_444_part_00
MAPTDGTGEQMRATTLMVATAAAFSSALLHVLAGGEQQQQQQPQSLRRVPRWSWGTVQVHAHCSNTSGTVDLPLRPDVAQFFSTLPFVVIEKSQGLATAPAYHEAGQKQCAAGAQIKAYNASAVVLAYYQTDWVRTWFDSSVWFVQHPQYCLRNSTGALVVGKAPDFDLVYDYRQHEAQWMWASSLANMSTADHSAIDGWFIDGPFSISAGRPFGHGPFVGVNATTAAAWTNGLQQTLAMLRNLSGPEKLIIREHDPHTQCDECDGVMQQGWCKGAMDASDSVRNCIDNLVQAPMHRVHEINCGNCKHTSDQNTSLAIFLLGVRERMYFGHDAWSDCAVPYQLKFVKELSYPLGAPLGNYTVNNVSGGGQIYTRYFDGAGHGKHTVVTVRTYGGKGDFGLRQDGAITRSNIDNNNGDGRGNFASVSSACISWANGITTGVGCA